MKTRLGYHVLVAMGHDPLANLRLINVMINQSDDLSNRAFTLLCCCPAVYWEHGGGTSSAGKAGLGDELAQDDSRYEESIERADRMFEKASKLLQDAGVPASKISTRISFEDTDLTSTVVRELRTRHHSTVVVEESHKDIIDRLSNRGIWRLLPNRVPKVTVWAVDVPDVEAQTVPSV